MPPETRRLLGGRIRRAHHEDLPRPAAGKHSGPHGEALLGRRGGPLSSAITGHHPSHHILAVAYGRWLQLRVLSSLSPTMSDQWMNDYFAESSGSESESEVALAMMATSDKALHDPKVNQ